MRIAKCRMEKLNSKFNGKEGFLETTFTVKVEEISSGENAQLTELMRSPVTVDLKIWEPPFEQLDFAGKNNTISIGRKQLG